MPTHPTRTRPQPATAGWPSCLGSGGVRSAAAVGIAEVLAGAGVRPDLVVGCSSGALVGATIAVRMSPEHALQTASELLSARS